MARWVPLLLLAAALSGCTGESAGPSPNFVAPKLVLAARDDGNLTLFVHAAIGERAYDWLSLSVDNASVVNRTSAYSLEESVNGTSVFVTVSAMSGDQLYAWRGHVEVLPVPGAERARIARLDDEDVWSEPRLYSLPFEQILDHARAG